MTPFIVDAHLDVAMNALLNRRDLSLSVQEIRNLECRSREQAMISLPDLEKAGVGLVCATLFVVPASSAWAADYLANMTAATNMKVYSTPEEAETQALEQLEVYLRWQDRGLVRIITSQNSLAEHLLLWQQDRKLGLIVLMESADPIVKPDGHDWIKQCCIQATVETVRSEWGLHPRPSQKKKPF